MANLKQTLLIALLLIIWSSFAFAHLTKQLEPDVCHLFGSEITAPPDFIYRGDRYYPYAGSAMQIFTSASIPCNGYLQSWRFIPQRETFLGLRLAVFRKLRSHFAIVNETRIDISFRDIQAFPNGGEVYFDQNQWLELILPDPFEVQRGDYLGVYYESFYYVNESLVIKTTSKLLSDGKNKKANVKPNTYIYIEDDSTIMMKEAGCCTRKLLDIRRAGVAFREPALTAVISPTRTLNYHPPIEKSFFITPYLYRPRGNPMRLPNGLAVFQTVPGGSRRQPSSGSKINKPQPSKSSLITFPIRRNALFSVNSTTNNNNKFKKQKPNRNKINQTLQSQNQTNSKNYKNYKKPAQLKNNIKKQPLQRRLLKKSIFSF